MPKVFLQITLNIKEENRVISFTWKPTRS